MRAAALCVAWAAVSIAGCVAAPARLADADLASCMDLLGRVDDSVSRAGVGDAMATRIPGWPHLRADRFLASFAHEPLDEAQFAEWLRRMADLGMQAYRVEIANLPADTAHTVALVEACTRRLAASDVTDRAGRDAMRAAVVVPDDYSSAQRVAGLYWLTRIPFSYGVRRWQEEVREAFQRPVESVPLAGERRRSEPPPGVLAPEDIATLLERASANALRIPTPSEADADALFRTYAPTFVVDTAAAADVPGAVVLDAAGRAIVRPGPPVVYRRLSHARHQGRVLLQLNYWLWFPERPPSGSWDLLSGALDGLLWRVTLSPEGIPLAFDSIHPCGCYHLFFPTPRAIPRTQPEGLDEAGFVPTSLPTIASGDRVELWLESSTHYLRRVVVGGVPAVGTPYTFAEDDSLRSLPLPAGGYRSAFRPDGIVAGTERGERWLFWPMGIAEPGAMRQWGRHATAFVGRRHFDDPGLLSRYFDLVIIP